VTLLHGAMGASGLVVGPISRNGRPNNLSAVRADGFTAKEVVGTTAINIGRASATVARYSLKLDRGGFSFTPIGEAIGPSLPLRLEPGESASWYAEMDSARALVHASSSVRRVSSYVRMTIEMGTGDTITTRKRLYVGSSDRHTDSTGSGPTDAPEGVRL
jgi:hypothetical protein